MRIEGTFSVAGFEPRPTPEMKLDVTTGAPLGVAAMEKHFAGEVEGKAATLFCSAFDATAGIGTYVAIEQFEGTLAGRRGTCNFVHAASTHGTDRFAEYFAVVPGSGTAQLAGIEGDGGIAIDADGTHRIWFDVEFGA